MQSSIPVFSWFLIIAVWVIFGFMFVAAVVGTILFFAGRPHSGVRRVGGSLAAVCGAVWGVVLLGSLVLVGVVPAFQQYRESARRELTHAELKRLGEELHNQSGESEHIESRPELAVAPILVAEAEPDLKQLPTEQSVEAPLNQGPQAPQDDRTAASAPTPPLPEWTGARAARDGDVTYIVLSSKQYATVDDARNEIASEAVTLLVQDFERIYDTSAQNLHTLPLDTLKSIAVRKEYVETVNRDFGNFFAPMHRVWWQLELSPVVRTSLHPLWKSQLQETRVLLVGGSLLAITLCLAGVSVVSHWRRSAAAKRQPPIDPSAAVLAVGALTLLGQRCKRWWKA